MAALILAAGRSSRMGKRNKLLIPDGSGCSMVGRVVRAALASRAAEVVVVTGHQAGQVGEAARLAAGPADRLRIVHAAGFADGLSASLKTGIEALGDTAAALVCLGDMPLVTAAAMDLLIAAYLQGAPRAIIVPTCRGVRGNPVLWDRAFFPAMSALSGDRGARALLARHAADVAELDIGDEAVLLDFDTPEALRMLRPEGDAWPGGDTFCS